MGETPPEPAPRHVSASTGMDLHAMTLRPARPEDQAFLFELFASTRADEIAGLGAVERDAFLRAQFEAQRRTFAARFPAADHRIISIGDRPVGRILVDRGEAEMRLLDIALMPEFRNGGAGATLVGGLLAEAREAGKPVRLEVLVASRAVHLYERLGFVKVHDNAVFAAMEWSAREAT